MFDLARLQQIAQGPHPAALCIVTQTRGSTPRKAGASMVVVADGSALGFIEGTIGGGTVEHRVREEALAAIAQGVPRSVDFALTASLGMCCGGQMTIYVEPLRQKPPLFLFGAGHVGMALCAMASQAGFAVTVVDEREEMLTPARFPQAVALSDSMRPSDIAALPFGVDVFVVIATHDHQLDQHVAEHILRLPFRYAALVGSRRKAILTQERCKNKGIDEEIIKKLRCPAGLDIGAETPEEIAVSILGEMIAYRRQKNQA